MFRLLAVLATVARRAARSPLLCIEVYLETEHRLSQSASADAGSVATRIPPAPASRASGRGSPLRFADRLGVVAVEIFQLGDRYA
jgi:hypothetical protein